MDAQSWVIVLGALGLFIPIFSAAVVSIIIAVKTGQKVDATAVKVDQAATRREEIANTIIEPTSLPPPPAA